MTITVKLFTYKATIVKISIENTVDCSEWITFSAKSETFLTML